MIYTFSAVSDVYKHRSQNAILFIAKISQIFSGLKRA